MSVNTSEIAGEDNNEIVFYSHYFVIFFIRFWIHTRFLLSSWFFDIIYEEWTLYGCYSLHFELSGKASFILYILNRIFLNGVNEKSLKSNKSVRWNCCQFKTVKILLMYALVTLLIKKYLVAATYIFSSIYWKIRITRNF